jgi:hypothetical protein
VPVARGCSTPEQARAADSGSKLPHSTCGVGTRRRNSSDTVSIILSDIILFALLGGVPGVMVWGWVRWIRGNEPRNLWSVLSLLGLSFATASVPVLIASILWVRSIPGYDSAYPDPPGLVLLNRATVCLAVASTVTAVAGAWKRSPIRWHALVGAIGTLFIAVNQAL